jgi:hypothetical protein
MHYQCMRTSGRWIGSPEDGDSTSRAAPHPSRSPVDANMMYHHPPPPVEKKNHPPPPPLSLPSFLIDHRHQSGSIAADLVCN